MGQGGCFAPIFLVREDMYLENQRSNPEIKHRLLALVKKQSITEVDIKQRNYVPQMQTLGGK